MSRQAIILAGGAGTRLRERLGDLPKPMIPIAGKPLLEHQVELCQRFGFMDLVFFIHYRADLIEKHFGNGAKWGVKIRHVVEKEPLGTAGAVLEGFDAGGSIRRSLWRHDGERGPRPDLEGARAGGRGGNAAAASE